MHLDDFLLIWPRVIYPVATALRIHSNEIQLPIPFVSDTIKFSDLISLLPGASFTNMDYF